jgi:hypothetical protein
LPRKSRETLSDEMLRIASPFQLARRFLDCEDALALVKRRIYNNRNDGTKRKRDRLQESVVNKRLGIDQAFVGGAQMEYSQDARDSIQNRFSRVSYPPCAEAAHAVNRQNQ